MFELSERDRDCVLLDVDSDKNQDPITDGQISSSIAYARIQHIEHTHETRVAPDH